MKILITGANGMLARALIKHCLIAGDEVFAFTRKELDITDAEAIQKAVAAAKPDALINCAAYTDVDGCETNDERCFAVNSYAVEKLASACGKNHCVFVTVSTDYVFDGKSSEFYTEDDLTSPLSVYGKAKRDGEIRAQNENEDSIIVRAGWIFGEGGTNFLSRMPEFLSQGRSIKAISDSYGTPTYAKDLAIRLRELAELNVPGIYHVANSGNGASFDSFAEKLCEIKGYDKGLIEAVSTNELKRPAPRPRSSKLASIKEKNLGLPPLRNWEIALKEFVSQND